ncbi:hypothetical protein LTR78_006385 [Recurvomyces mirabilis]|uniref:Uncharacterized protein n=1 Tax=Recurvomyces mirabilis TaxID=574656 RepID=A0AAE0WLC8_9PEZI|nr:hypothetical protein LTR78_006385 [Recurvomyces mirabilis]KAK5152272.1 hypothetical protein LTS14_008649 [Recurvomyces mirabilis]
MTKQHKEAGSDKRKVSLGGFFAQFRKPQKKHEDDAESEDDHSGNESKQRQAAKRPFEEFSSPLVRKEDQCAIYDGLDSALEEYNDGVQSSMQDLLDPVVDELDARSRGFDTHRRRIKRQGIPTHAEIDALEAQNSLMSKPMDQDDFEVESTRSNGTKVIERYNMKRVITAYRDLHARKRAEIESLELEISTLDTELEQAYKDVSNENLPTLKRAQGQWESNQAKFKEASQAAKDLLAEEFDRAKAEEKSAAVEMNRKISAFMKEL